MWKLRNGGNWSAWHRSRSYSAVREGEGVEGNGTEGVVCGVKSVGGGFFGGLGIIERFDLGSGVVRSPLASGPSVARDFVLFREHHVRLVLARRALHVKMIGVVCVAEHSRGIWRVFRQGWKIWSWKVLRS